MHSHFLFEISVKIILLAMIISHIYINLSMAPFFLSPVSHLTDHIEAGVKCFLSPFPKFPTLTEKFSGEIVLVP